MLRKYEQYVIIESKSAEVYYAPKKAGGKMYV